MLGFMKQKKTFNSTIKLLSVTTQILPAWFSPIITLHNGLFFKLLERYELGDLTQGEKELGDFPNKFWTWYLDQFREYSKSRNGWILYNFRVFFI